MLTQRNLRVESSCMRMHECNAQRFNEGKKPGGIFLLQRFGQVLLVKNGDGWYLPRKELNGRLPTYCRCSYEMARDIISGVDPEDLKTKLLGFSLCYKAGTCERTYEVIHANVQPHLRTCGKWVSNEKEFMKAIEGEDLSLAVLKLAEKKGILAWGAKKKKQYNQ